MSTKKILPVVLFVGLVLLAFWAPTALALPTQQESGTTISYPGLLTGENGQPVADGAYAFTFALYDAPYAGKLLWTENQANLPVKEGRFFASLGDVAPISTGTLESDELWLEVAVRGPGEADFTSLSPRQQLNENSLSSTTSGPSCPHDHFGESWTGDTATLNDGLRVENTKTDGIGVTGVAHNGPDGAGVFGWSTQGYGVRGSSTDGSGVYATSESGFGLWAVGPIGVQGVGSNTGVSGFSSDGTGVVGSSGHYGVYALGTGGTSAHPALRADNWNTTNGMAAYFTNNSGHPTLELDQSGSGRVLDLQNNGEGDGTGSGDFIIGFGKNIEFRFRVGGRGDFWSADGYYTTSQDFAEMLPAVDGLEPGDVLAIGADGLLTRCTQTYQGNVVGVYSTKPGFVGGQPAQGEAKGSVPLAIVGVVPVKVSAESGPIQPGDLLVSSSMPGYAMKAGENPPQGTVIGKALEVLDEGHGVILMLVTLQ